MRQQIKIPCTLMRGGTSRGPFFRASDLPQDRDERDAILLSAMGSGHELQIDGIGGGHPLTSKVAIVGPPTKAGADVDYLFAQVNVRDRVVDTSPNCGNMLAAVGPFAIDTGLVRAASDVTQVRIHNVNTGKLIEACVETPGGEVIYDGDARIDGVPGRAAPIRLRFLNAAGAKTGKLFPTGAIVDTVEGIEVTCIDAAMPLMIVRARDLGKTGWEQPSALNEDRAFLQRLETLRLEAGRRMGFPNVAELVIPKPVLLAPAQNGGAFSARYFMPHSCHTALAITGAVGLATACTQIGTVARAFAGEVRSPATLSIEHPLGSLEVRLEAAGEQNEPVVSVLRTARRLFEGAVYVRDPRADVRSQIS